jgi:hypothetical protein
MIRSRASNEKPVFDIMANHPGYAQVKPQHQCKWVTGRTLAVFLSVTILK